MAKGISTGGVRRDGNIGEQIATRVAVRPVQQAAGAATSVIIDRAMGGGPWLTSFIYTVFTGALSGSPTTASVAHKVQHDTDSAGGSMVDATAGRFGAISGTIADSAENNQESVVVDCTHLNRYVQIVVTPAFTGGSTPKVEVSAIVVTGEYDGQTPITQEAES